MWSLRVLVREMTMRLQSGQVRDFSLTMFWRAFWRAGSGEPKVYTATRKAKNRMPPRQKPFFALLCSDYSCSFQYLIEYATLHMRGYRYVQKTQYRRHLVHMRNRLFERVSFFHARPHHDKRRPHAIIFLRVNALLVSRRKHADKDFRITRYFLLPLIPGVASNTISPTRSVGSS